MYPTFQLQFYDISERNLKGMWKMSMRNQKNKSTFLKVNIMDFSQYLFFVLICERMFTFRITNIFFCFLCEIIMLSVNIKC